MILLYIFEVQSPTYRIGLGNIDTTEGHWANTIDEKCKFFNNRIDYLVHVIMQDGY